MSLRLKFMLVPAAGFLLIAVLFIIYIELTRSLHYSNQGSLNKKFNTIQSFVHISNDLAANHVHIYDLLSRATEYESEGEFYDAGKVYLLEIHRLEEAMKSSVDVASLSLAESERFNQIIGKLIDYRNNTVNAILMATVEQDLANRVLTDSTAQYNELSARILEFSELNQSQFNSELTNFYEALKNHLQVFVGIFLAAILSMMLISYVLSRYLSRDISKNIELLGDLMRGHENGAHQPLKAANEMRTLRNAVIQVRHLYDDLRQMGVELRDKEGRLRTILENISDAMIIIDAEGRISDFNIAAERMFLCDSKDAAGRYIADFLGVSAGNNHLKAIDLLNNGHGKAAAGKIREAVGVRSDDSRFDIEYTLTELRLNDVDLYVLLLRDVTEIKAAYTELENYRTHLEELVSERTMALELANKELEAFSYSVSHDLRSPLRSINGFSLAVIEDYADVLDETGMSYLARVRNSARDMSAIIDDMLQLSRMSRVPMNVKTVNLTEMAEDVIRSLQEEAPERTVKLTLQPHMRVAGDKGLLRIMLDNLLGNAWKYTSKKTVGEISFTCSEVDGETVYLIEDNGAGFDMEYSGRLFTEFTRLHKAEEFPGTGIGLATVQRILKRHNGRIWVEAAVDQGARFYFTLHAKV